MRERKVFHVIGERPGSVDITDQLGRTAKIEIPADWLIFNAPRPLWASPVEVVVREAMTIGEFSYGAVVNEIYPMWVGEFYHGRFFAAVRPDDERRIDDNVSDDGWVLVFHSEDELVEAARKRYLEKTDIDPAEIDEIISQNRRSAAAYQLDLLNDYDY